MDNVTTNGIFMFLLDKILTMKGLRAISVPDSGWIFNPGPAGTGIDYCNASDKKQ